MRTNRSRRLLGAVIAIGLVALFGWYSARHSVDFPVYHHAGSQILNGDFELYPSGLYEGQSPVGGHSFRYAPAIALLFAPLAILPLEGAAFLFFALKAAVFVHTFALVSTLVGMRDRVWALIGIAVMSTGGYLVEEFRNGNFHFVVVWLMVVAFDGGMRRDVLTPAAALAVAIASKITPLVLLAYFVVRRAAGVVLATIALLVLAWLLPILLWGYEWNQRLVGGFLKYTFMKMEEGPTSRNYSFRGALIRFDPLGLSPDTIDWVWLGASALAALAVLLVIRRDRISSGLVPALDLALMITAMPLFSPHTQRIHFASLAVPAAILWACVRTTPALRWRSLGVAAIVCSAAASTFIPPLLPGRRLSLAYVDLSVYTFAALLMFIALLVLSYEIRTHAATQRARAAVTGGH